MTTRHVTVICTITAFSNSKAFVFKTVPKVPQIDKTAIKIRSDLSKPRSILRLTSISPEAIQMGRTMKRPKSTWPSVRTRKWIRPFSPRMVTETVQLKITVASDKPTPIRVSYWPRPSLASLVELQGWAMKSF